MAVPEAAVDENRLAAAGENDIRPSGQVLAMEAIAVAHGVETAADNHLRLGVATLDRLHDAPALLGGAGVHGAPTGYSSVGRIRPLSVAAS